MTMPQVTTGTTALDGATMARALTALAQAAGTGMPWMPIFDQSQPQYRWQDEILVWYFGNWEAIERLTGLKVMTADSAEPLNRFLQDAGFNPLFRDISPGGVGACAILDMLVEWMVMATLVTMRVPSQGQPPRDFTAFEVPLEGVDVFNLPGRSQLVKLKTQDGGGLWIVMNDRPTGPMDLIHTAMAAMRDRQPAAIHHIRSVIVPTLDIDVEVDLSWLLGISSGDHVIDQAFQMVKVRVNEQGARAKTATGMSTTRGMAIGPRPLRFDRPFTGWFTQPGSEIPICVFYADRDSWKRPSSLDL